MEEGQKAEAGLQVRGYAKAKEITTQAISTDPVSFQRRFSGT